MLTRIKSVYKYLSPKYQNLFLEYKVDPKPRHGRSAHSLLYEIINSNREIYAFYLKIFLEQKEKIQTIKTCDNESSETEPCWNNGFLPGLDIVALYSFIGIFKPKQYIEIGSGNSTKVVRRSIKENKLNTVITSIDPMPRASIDNISDHIIREPIEKLDDLSIFGKLEKNDILFIDNSHRCFPNSDVTVCFLEILPKLKPGVVVHFHDIYLPYDYPQFMTDRFYSEQYLLACYLLASKDKFNIIMPNYFVSEDSELSETIAPMWGGDLQCVEKHGGSFWFVVN